MLELLSLSLSQFGLGVKMFFHGQVAGSEQKYAPLPCFLCMEHPNHSPGGKSGCLDPLFGLALVLELEEEDEEDEDCAPC